MRSGRQERYARKSEAEDLKRVFHRLDSKGDNKIDVEELMATFAQYKHKVTKVIAATHFRWLSSRSPARPRGPENADARWGEMDAFVVPTNTRLCMHRPRRRT